MRLFKNKIALLIILVLAIFGSWGLLMVESKVYGYNDSIKVRCNYNGNKLFLEGRLGEWEDLEVGNGDGSKSVSGAKLTGIVFNIIGKDLKNGYIKNCTGVNINIESKGFYRLGGDEGRLKVGSISCPFSGYISFFKIKEEGEDEDEDWKYVLIPAKCSNPNNPYELFIGKNISEGSVLFKVDDVKPLALSYDGRSLVDGRVAVVDANGNVVSKPVDDLIVQNAAPDWQPQFTDIVLLQLKTISYLVNQIKLQDNNFDISNILAADALTGYYQVLGKIRFDTRSALADDVYQPVTLSDIGILAQIQDGLLKKLISNDSPTVTLNHQLQDPMDNYTLGEIQSILSGDLILAKNLVDTNLSWLTGYDNLSGQDWYQDYDELVKIRKGDMPDDTSFAVGFQQNLRKDNIEYLKNQLSNNDLNLLGIYNGYYEILQVIKGNEYASLLINIKSNPDTSLDNFNLLGDLVTKEADDLGIYPPWNIVNRICNVLSGSPMGDIMSVMCQTN